MSCNSTRSTAVQGKKIKIIQITATIIDTVTKKFWKNIIKTRLKYKVFENNFCLYSLLK